MLRQLLLVLVVLGMVMFTGCKKTNGVNGDGTTTQDGVTQPDESQETPDGTAADDYSLQRGTRDTQDTTTPDSTTGTGDTTTTTPTDANAM